VIARIAVSLSVVSAAQSDGSRSLFQGRPVARRRGSKKIGGDREKRESGQGKGQIPPQWAGMVGQVKQVLLVQAHVGTLDDVRA
jgi:hypothetical protein